MWFSIFIIGYVALFCLVLTGMYFVLWTAAFWDGLRERLRKLPAARFNQLFRLNAVAATVVLMVWAAVLGWHISEDNFSRIANYYIGGIGFYMLPYFSYLTPPQ